jgi:hypothetical protein
MAPRATAKVANALPECIVNTNPIVATAREALSARASKAQYELAEKTAKERLASLASDLRIEHANVLDDYLGIIRVVQPEGTEEMPPVRIEFKMAIKDSALRVTELDTLNELFGALRPQLWEATKIVTDIHSPQALYDSLKASGMNPFDFLTVTVKENMDNIVAQHPGVTAVESLVPKTGFLARVQEFGKNLTEGAKYYIRRYLERALSSAVTLGSKGKSA